MIKNILQWIKIILKCMDKILTVVDIKIKSMLEHGML